MADFANLDMRFTNPAEFSSWLNQHPPDLAWDGPAEGSTIHNTYIPNKKTWAGHASMASMENTYRAKGWITGPHVYLAAGTQYDGIWLMTPPWLQGTHAGGCNGRRFGIEIVDDWEINRVAESQIDLAVATAAVLHRWAGLPPDANCHHDCMPNRTCPGRFGRAAMPEIRRRLALALAAGQLQHTAQSPILGSSSAALSDIVLNMPMSTLYTPYDIQSVILPAYYRQAIDCGINPVIAIAQACHETAWDGRPFSSFWSGRPHRNPAGIGVTGNWSYTRMPGYQFNHQRARWEIGLSFTDWARESIPAHLGRLLAYCLPAGSGTDKQKALIDRALKVRPLPAELRGSVITLAELGAAHNRVNSGRPPEAWIGWAVKGFDYGEKIAAWANRLSGIIT